MARNDAEFVHRENIKHIELELEAEANPTARALLLKRLASERAKLSGPDSGKTAGR